MRVEIASSVAAAQCRLLSKRPLYNGRAARCQSPAFDSQMIISSSKECQAVLCPYGKVPSMSVAAYLPSLGCLLYRSSQPCPWRPHTPQWGCKGSCRLTIGCAHSVNMNGSSCTSIANVTAGPKRLVQCMCGSHSKTRVWRYLYFASLSIHAVMPKVL